MKNQRYIAWLDGQSVAVGTQKHVKEQAIKAFQESKWRNMGEWPQATLKITTACDRQLFVSSVVLHGKQRLRLV